MIYEHPRVNEKEMSVEAAIESAERKLPEFKYYFDHWDLLQEDVRSPALPFLRKLLLRAPNIHLFHETAVNNVEELAGLVAKEGITTDALRNRFFERYGVKLPSDSGQDYIPPQPTLPEGDPSTYDRISVSMIPWWWSKRAPFVDPPKEEPPYRVCLMLVNDESKRIRDELSHLRGGDARDSKILGQYADEWLELVTAYRVAPRHLAGVFLKHFTWTEVPTDQRDRLKRRLMKLGEGVYSRVAGSSRRELSDFDIIEYLDERGKYLVDEEKIIQESSERTGSFAAAVRTAENIGIAAGLPVFDYYGNQLWPKQHSRIELQRKYLNDNSKISAKGGSASG